MIRNVPDGWRVEQLGDVFKLQQGKHLAVNDLEEDGYIVYGANGIIGKYSQYMYEDSKVLITCRGATCGSINISKPKSWITGNAIALLNKPDDIDDLYVAYFLKKDKLHSVITGSAQPQIVVGNLSKKKIPIPPLPQQEKIVKVLDISSALIEKQRELITKYDLFLKSKFIEMFGDPVLNPKKWEVVKMGTLMKIRRGASPRPIDKFIGNDVPWIKIGDGSKGNDLYIEDTKVKIIQEGVSKSVYLKKGSLIFANCGVSLGFSRILKIDGCIHDGWLSFEDIDEKINKIFILKLINHSTQRLRDSASGGTQPNLNIAIMKNFTIYLPPIDLQNKFATIVEKTEQIKEQETKKLEHLQTLHVSLMDKAFKGEIS